MDNATRRLQQHLHVLGYRPDVLLFQEITGSTNDDAKQLSAQGVERALVASRQQTQGRGQHDRQWLSPQGNVYLSILLPSATALDGRLALEVGLNILDMPCLNGLNLQLKWPNDLYSPLGKWGGILIEALNPHQLVVGVGLNLFTPTHQEQQPITSLQDLGLQQPDALQMIAQLYHAVMQAQQWFEHGCYRLAQRFNHHAAFMQQSVCFEHPQGQLRGIFAGISASGAAIICTEQQHEFYQGRIRLHDHHDYMSSAPQQHNPAQVTSGHVDSNSFGSVQQYNAQQ